ncbi:hypothetical protein [uncultured Bifidobacterium sp.]|uniref:hypothetical protein n=1 Tax=uncultured Bifidobacterium sp. TaxID=165187 RepID=UPI0028DCF91F|nr:hypothetical protein [uncultured Bifidobacterium sp.]
MDLTIDAGDVPRGEYGRIIVRRRATLDAGVVFRRLEVHGFLRCGDCRGGDLLIRAGCIDCVGVMRVGEIRGHGVLRVDGDVLCSRLELTGTAKISRRVECSGDVHVRGMLDAPQSVRAREVRISGTVRTRSLKGLDVVEVHPLEGILLSRPGMEGYREGSRASEVTGTTVRLVSMRCGNVQGREVVLAAGSHVHTARFTECLTRDSRSSVLIVEGDRRRVRRIGS